MYFEGTRMNTLRSASVSLIPVALLVAGAMRPS
jgi:hypothetical protein